MQYACASCSIKIHRATQTKGTTMNTETFPAGSEFRVDYSIEKANPRFIKGSMNMRTAYPTILTEHKSPVFDTYEQALQFVAESGITGNYWVQVKTPGSKRFIMSAYARKVAAA